ncbi:unnamed protein product [Meloidogyne enterolobii]|uniref:Uncharacterized protein n=1 Tax=Meloidogyne enterolobii TaxID=390850 RepID=A0ACB0YFF2_MELEN
MSAIVRVLSVRLFTGSIAYNPIDFTSFPNPFHEQAVSVLHSSVAPKWTFALNFPESIT